MKEWVGQVKQASAGPLFMCHIKHSDGNSTFFIEVKMTSEGHDCRNASALTVPLLDTHGQLLLDGT